MQGTAFIPTQGASPGASPVCLSRRSSCGSSWLISTAAAAAPTQALQSSVSKQEQIQFLGAAHLGAPCSSWTLMLDGSPANSALLICPTKGTPKPQPVSAFPLPCALTCLRTSVSLNLEEGTKQRGRVICPCSGQRTDFWVGWGREEKTTGVLTVINTGLNVRALLQDLIQDTGCFLLLSLFSITAHYFGERKHCILLCVDVEVRTSTNHAMPIF